MSNKPAKQWLSPYTLKLVEERRNLKPKRRENTENRRHYNYLCGEIKRQSGQDKETYLRNMSFVKKLRQHICTRKLK